MLQNGSAASQFGSERRPSTPQITRSPCMCPPQVCVAHARLHGPTLYGNRLAPMGEADVVDAGCGLRCNARSGCRALSMMTNYQAADSGLTTYEFDELARQ
jgi:hypothetical protein